MSQGVDKENLGLSSLWGIARGVSVHTCIYPLEVVKIRLQSSPIKKSLHVALEILQREGLGAFYKGLAPQLLKTSIKQLWCWPMMAGVPSIFERYHIENLQQQALTGLSIATVDAAISTPLERAKIVSALKGKGPFCLKKVYKEGWRGFATHWSKLSVNWTVFLTAQKYLRDQASESSAQPLTSPELIKIGVQVALLVSLASAPFDLANTQKMGQNLKMASFFSKGNFSQFFRGWHLNFVSLCIHNIASIALMTKLGI